MGLVLALNVKHLFLQLSLFALSIIFFSCSVEDDDTQKSGSNTSNVTIKKPNSEISVIKTFNYPKVYIEEFDQSQEFFKEQHETSFSYVTKKNWFSYTAQKDGILTKILLLVNQTLNHLTITGTRCMVLFAKEIQVPAQNMENGI